ncbi:formin-1-like [Zingiber officinale]|uniref:formin-1-like n=1 Tax=Zingiber officinale TaxID=94328 RepID=UPI001C4BAC55|nr:formin-1-like [Zingiber officinale]
MVELFYKEDCYPIRLRPLSVGPPLQISHLVLLAEDLPLSDRPPSLVPRLRVHPSLPPLLAPGLRLLFTNVTYASPAFREASQAARRARSANDLLNRDAPSSSRRRARLPSEDSDSDDQPLALRLRRQAPHPVPDSSPSAIPSPSPPVAVASPPSPPIATPTPVPSQAYVLPDPSTVPVKPPLAQPSPSEVQVDPPLVQPSTSQQPPSIEAGPSQRPSSTTSPPEPSLVPPSAPSGSAARPSSSAAGPSQPPSPVCAKSLTINKSFHAVHYQNKMLRDKVVELELQLNNPMQANHALRAEVKDLAKRKNSLEVSLAISDRELKGLKEEKSQVDVVHQQYMDQQTLEHRRAIDQLTQKLRVAETLAQEQGKKLKSQEAQLTSQAAELLTARTELAQARVTAEGISTALAIYKEGENDSCQQSHTLYLRSPEFCTQVGQRFSTSVIFGAARALQQLYE